MQFTTKLTALVAVAAALVAQVASSPAPVANVVSVDEFMNWLATTDAELKFVGQPINNDTLVPRAAQNIMVTYCTRRTQNVCGGSCTVYNGPAACLDASGTSCLSATANVGFCDRGACGGSCNQFASCGTRLDNNFCATPGTRSINVPPS